VEPEPLHEEDPRRGDAEAREIEARLRGAGLDYEKKETKAFGGYSRVAFRVVAPRDMVPVHSSRAPMSRSGWQAGNSTGSGSNRSPAAPVT